MKETFWDPLERLVGKSTLLIDRPKNTQHSTPPERVYFPAGGYLEDSSAGDNAGIDGWSVPPGSRAIPAVDLHKREIEIKILPGCSEEECWTILTFHIPDYNHAFQWLRSEETL